MWDWITDTWIDFVDWLHEPQDDGYGYGPSEFPDYDHVTYGYGQAIDWDDITPDRGPGFHVDPIKAQKVRPVETTTTGTASQIPWATARENRAKQLNTIEEVESYTNKIKKELDNTYANQIEAQELEIDRLMKINESYSRPAVIQTLFQNRQSDSYLPTGVRTGRGSSGVL